MTNSAHRHAASYRHIISSGTSVRFGGRLVSTGTCDCGIEVVQLLTEGLPHYQQRAPWRPVAELLGPATVSLVKVPPAPEVGQQLNDEPKIYVTQRSRPGYQADWHIADNSAAVFTLHNGRAMRAATVLENGGELGDMRVRCIPQTKTGRDFRNHHGVWVPVTELPDMFRDELLATMTTVGQAAEAERLGYTNVEAYLAAPGRLAVLPEWQQLYTDQRDHRERAMPDLW